jgi:hypothetical protein
MLHTCVQTFDVTGNLEIFWELNVAFPIIYLKSGPGGSTEVQEEMDAVNCCICFPSPIEQRCRYRRWMIKGWI